MEDEFYKSSTDLNGYNDDFDIFNSFEDEELFDILQPQEAKTPLSPPPQQSAIPTTLSETSLYDYHQLHLSGEYFEEEEEYKQPVASPITSPVELPVTVASFSADNSQSDNNSSKAIIMESPVPAKINAKSPGRERRRKRTTSLCIDAIDDQKLASMSVSDLRQQMLGATREDIDNLTKRRRTVKNREYARTSRQKRSRERTESEKNKKTTEEELQCVRIELHRTQEKLAEVTRECNMWKSQYETLLNDFIGQKIV